MGQIERVSYYTSNASICLLIYLKNKGKYKNIGVVDVALWL